MAPPGPILILGAGVIGAAIAQALARRGAAVTLVDRLGVAPAASGKAGGFLALDWNDATALGPLARRSFALHRRLADELPTDYGFRPVDTLMAVGADPEAAQVGPGPDNPDWLDGGVAVQGALGSHATTAQVHPRRFTEALVADAQAHGARLRVGRVDGLERDGPEGAVRGALVDGAPVEAGTVVAALGPWTPALGLALPRVHGLKGSSITLRAEVPAQVVFSEFVTRDGRRFSPEIYPRRDGEVYLCGVPSDDALPESPDRVAVDSGDCELLREMAAGHSRRLAAAPVVSRQACFRPVTRDGLPLIGPVPGAPGALVATGHGPWGILSAPATGEMVAEMILDGETTLDATPFAPDRRSA
jgi:glycine/D-amino acid oxidase-like deaminating enzyme